MWAQEMPIYSLAVPLVIEGKKYGWDSSHLPSLDCTGCNLCCDMGEIYLHDTEDDKTQYECETLSNGRVALKRRSDGRCIYLTDKGCSIQNHKPLTCRLYDCRIAYEKASHLPPGYARNMRMWSRAVQKGRKLLAESSYRR